MLTNIENTPIQKAIMYVKELSADEKLREKALHDEASALKTAKAEGKTEGIELVALNMLKQGIISKELY